MEIKAEYVLKGLGLVIEDLKLDSKRHRPYTPTIHMPKCAYFPSFGGKEVADSESQGHMVVANKVGVPTTCVTNDTSYSEVPMKERLFVVLFNSLHHFMQRVFIKISASWAHSRPLLQSPFHPRSVLHGNQNIQCTP